MKKEKKYISNYTIGYISDIRHIWYKVNQAALNAKVSDNLI